MEDFWAILQTPVPNFCRFSCGPIQTAHNTRPHRKGVLAQLVERRNGIAEVRGSNPLGSTIPLEGIAPSMPERWIAGPRKRRCASLQDDPRARHALADQRRRAHLGSGNCDLINTF